MKEAFAYVDPGSGYVFLQNAPFLWGCFLALLMFLLIPLRFFLKRIKRFYWIIIAIIIILFIIGVVMGVMMNKDLNKPKVIILGIDAMDAEITQKLMGEGKLPHFSYLKEKGSFSLLSTTNPAESVVAWTSFSTGLNPGGHGIFDFVMRNPQNYLPYLSLNEVSLVKGRPRVKIHNKGDTFWSILSQNKIPSFIYFCPNTFPAQQILGKLISGMGVPDISGTMGRFSFYTTKLMQEEDKDSRGEIIPVTVKEGVIFTRLYGPKMAKGASIIKAETPLKITLKPEEEKVFLEFQEKRTSLKKGNWSGWQKVSFKIGLFKKARGIVRFYLKSIGPHFELYASPINFDPQAPLFPISYPHNYSKKLSQRVGLFHTQGMPHDTWALSEERLDEKAFLGQLDTVLEERKKILSAELADFKNGVFFFYFDTLDALQHMFWRSLDQRHPLYESDSLYKETIFEYYQKMDLILGEVLKKIDKDTVLIVLSDHGFGSFRKSINLNRWLLENGFLFLKNGINEGRQFLEDIYWSKTKAYALGFGGIYLNRRGREKYGIVSESEAEAVKKQIIDKLRQLRDAATGENVVKDVYTAEEIFAGLYVNDGPDLFVGFNQGFRASWQTALGGAPKILIEDNKKKWSGDHLLDPSLVEGVIFVNKKVELKEPHIIDVVPTVLNLFDIPKPKELQGKELF